MSGDWHRVSDQALEELARGFFTWRALETKIRAEEDLDPVLKSAALAAIPVVQKHLGNNWPFKAWQSGHLFAEVLWVNKAPWTRKYLTDLADAMSAVAGLDRWQGLRSRIRLPDQAVAATFELGLAARALDAGLHVELEPPTPSRRADLAVSRAVRTSEKLYIEAKHIQAFPKRAYDTVELFERVFPMPHWGLQGGGRFLRSPLPDEISALLQEVDEFWAERRESRTRGDLVIAGLLEMWAADPVYRKAEEYFVNRGYPEDGGSKSPPVTFDAFARILYAIRAESERLPHEHGGMIVLGAPVEPELLEVPSEVIGQAVEIVVRDLPHVNAVALIRRSPSPGPPTHEVRDLGRGHVSVRSPRFLIFSEEVIVVRNPRRVHMATDEIVDCLFMG